MRLVDELRGQALMSRYDSMDNDTFGKRYHRAVRTDIARSKYEGQERAYFDNDARGGGCLLVVAALVAGLAGFGVVNAPTADAAPAPQVLSGTGWKLDANKVTSIAPGTYTIEFDSTAARTKLTPYLKIAAANLQAQATGVKFVVSTTIQKRVTTGCQKQRTIVVSLEYRPLAKAGYSQGGGCYNTLDHSMWSGYMRINTEWFTPAWFSKTSTTNTYRIRNGVAHELGHAVGMMHPNYDKDHDGKIEDAECVLNTDKTRPLLCSPNGGSVTKAGSGHYTKLDVSGIKALVANYSKRTVS